MKSHWILCIAIVPLLSVAADAALTLHEYVPDQPVVYDDVAGLYWDPNLPRFVNMTYDQQMDAIAGMGTYGNIAEGWHMATLSEMQALWLYSISDIAAVFTPTDTDPLFLAGRYDEIRPDVPLTHYGARVQVGPTPAETWKDPLNTFAYWDFASNDLLSAWIVNQNAPVPPGTVIPAPSALLLSVVGVTSLLGAKRWRRKE